MGREGVQDRVVRLWRGSSGGSWPSVSVISISNPKPSSTPNMGPQDFGSGKLRVLITSSLQAATAKGAGLRQEWSGQRRKWAKSQLPITPFIRLNRCRPCQMLEIKKGPNEWDPAPGLSVDLLVAT